MQIKKGSSAAVTETEQETVEALRDSPGAHQPHTALNPEDLDSLTLVPSPSCSSLLYLEAKQIVSRGRLEKWKLFWPLTAERLLHLAGLHSACLCVCVCSNTCVCLSAPACRDRFQGAPVLCFLLLSASRDGSRGISRDDFHFQRSQRGR